MTDVRLVVIVASFFCATLASDKIYTNDWAVEIPGGARQADFVAAKRGYKNMGQIGALEGFYHFIRHSHPRRSRRSAHQHTVRLTVEPNVRWVEQQVVRKRVKRDFKMPQDPLWPKQWYLLNTGQASGPSGLDHNVVPAWKEGLTGKGVVVSILDDGIEYTHPDLKENYDAKASYDYNGRDPNPIPRYDFTNENRHGTRCAGEVAAAMNKVCGMGVAFKASIGGVRMLDGDVTDVVESNSLSLNPQHVDIYSSSWGPDDDGRTVDGPAALAQKAFKQGVLKGRGGLGSIFAWASGNGGRAGDCCNCDGYTNSIYTLSISSATDHGGKPWYLERCSSTLATTYSSGSYGQKQISTTDLHHKCTSSHTGTSASAPMAAGFFALALEANPKLTWRDMQHVTIRSCKVTDPKDSDWVTNSVGRKVNHKYGYGIIDAAALVKLAKTWVTVPEKRICEVIGKDHRVAVKDKSLILKLSTDACKGTGNEIHYLEHVQVRITLGTNRRGSVAFLLTSPQGTQSQLLHFRSGDSTSSGFSGWPFMTTHVWEENPSGEWTLEVQKNGQFTTASLDQWTLVMHGTLEAPVTGDVHCHVECDGGCSGPEAYECTKCRHFRLNGDNGRVSCVAACQGGLYGDEETRECLLCHVSCESCKGEMPSDCLSCRPNFTMSEGHCVEGCPPGFYSAPSRKDTSACGKCEPSCLSCFGPGVGHCSSCRPGMVMEDGQCKAECSKGKYLIPSGGICGNCDVTCGTCRGEKTTDCQSCGQERVWVEDTGECTEQCPDKYYQGFTDDGSPACRPCHASCSTCKDFGPGSCLTCAKGLLYSSGRCLKSCPLGTFLQDSDHCSSCNSSCDTCSGPGSNDCLTCNFPLVLHQGACLVDCPLGFYKDELICKHCDDSCSDCSGASASQCTSCRLPLFLYNLQCVDECPDGYYGNSDDRKCFRCDPTCESCDGPSKSQCTACALYYVLENSTCSFACPGGMYEDNEKCLPCHKGCTTCYGPTESNCYSCSTPTYLLNGRCVPKCPSGRYGDDAMRTCSVCGPPCSECDGPSTENCTGCYDLYYLRGSNCVRECAKEGEWLNIVDKSCRKCAETCLACDQTADLCTACRNGSFLSNSHCVSECPKGHAGTADGVCGKCSGGCEQCVGDLANCTACSESFFLSGSSCVRECPSGTYPATKTGTCRSCAKPCVTCSGGGETECVTCRTGDMLYMSSCVSSCPNRTYSDVRSSACSSCHAWCFTCSGPGEANCTGCERNLELSDGRCVASKNCSDGQYFDQTDEKCKACDASCAQCDGSAPTNCLSCSGTAYFDSMTSSCVSACPARHFPNSERNKCEPCHSTCEMCVGSDKMNCTSCADGLALLWNGACETNCPEGQYIDGTTTKSCKECQQECSICVDSAKMCLSCKMGFLLNQKSCVASCPDGTWLDPPARECRLCSDTCRTCAGGSGRCTDCSDGRFFLKDECLVSCPERYYANTTTLRCDSCGEDCLRCEPAAGGGHLTCTRCSENLKVFHDSCVSFCPAGYYVDIELDACSPCHATCAVCEGGGDADDCLTCSDSTAYLDGSRCVAACGRGSYESQEERQCKRCDVRCLECHGSSLNECSECATGFVYFAPSNSCVDACPEGYYDTGKLCRQCDDSCLTCQGPGSGACLKCADDLIKVEKQCLRSCPDGTYVEGVEGGHGHCVSCHQACLKCGGPLDDQCTACPGNAVLLNGKCASHCPGGFFYNETGRDCRSCHESCQTCFNAGPKSCVSCKGREILYDGDECVAECPNGHYREFRSCRKCDESCLTCSGGSRQDCLSCDGKKIVYEGVCVDQCKEDEFRGEDDACRPCHASCSSCRGSSETACISCESPRRLHKATGECLLCCSDKQIRSKAAGCCDCSMPTAKCIPPTQIPGKVPGSLVQKPNPTPAKASSVKTLEHLPTPTPHTEKSHPKANSSRLAITVAGSGIGVLLVVFLVALAAAKRGCCKKPMKYHPLTTDAELHQPDESDDEEDEFNQADDRGRLYKADSRKI